MENIFGECRCSVQMLQDTPSGSVKAIEESVETASQDANKLSNSNAKVHRASVVVRKRFPRAVV